MKLSPGGPGRVRPRSAECRVRNVPHFDAAFPTPALRPNASLVINGALNHGGHMAHFVTDRIVVGLQRTAAILAILAGLVVVGGLDGPRRPKHS